MSQFVLAVERDQAALGFFRTSLADEGLQVITAMGRADAVARAAAWMPVAALVGSGLGPETVTLVQELRREFALRALVAADPGEDDLLISALESGAVGFVIQPVSRALLATRVREALASRAVSDGHYLTAGPVTLDLDRHILVRPKPAAALTPCEFEMLRWFLTPPGRTFTRRQLLATDRAAFPPKAHDGMVDRHVESLRRKLGETGSLLERTGEIGWRFSLQGAAPAEIEFPLTNVNYDV